MSKKPRVLVTGANGLIGAHILNHDSEHYEVVGSSRRINGGLILDLEDQDAIRVVLDKVKPDVIVNCAGVTSIKVAADQPSLAEKVNVNAVQEIALWCSKNDTRLVHFSTDFVYDGRSEYYSESDSTNPLSIYGKTKLQSENTSLTLNKNTVIIRTSLVYGYLKGLSRMNFPLFIKSKLSIGEELNITADQFRSPTYAGDVASAVFDLIASDYTGVLHIAGPDRVSVYDFAIKICDVFSLKHHLLKPIETLRNDNDECERPMSTGLNIKKAMEIIDYAPCKIEHGLNEMMRSIAAK